jgi:hypothetical protein
MPGDTGFYTVVDGKGSKGRWVVGAAAEDDVRMRFEGFEVPIIRC